MKSLNDVNKKVLLAGILMIFGYGLVNNTPGFFVTPVSEAFGCSRAAFNLSYSVSCMVSLFAAPLAGQLLQKKNARNLILLGMAAGGLSFVGFAFCTKIQMFYLAAFFLGLIQQGTTSVTAMVLVNRAYQGNTGSATGLVMSGTGICSISMSIILPGFIETCGWRAGYLLEAVLWLAVMSGAYLLTKDTVEYPVEKSENTQGGDEGISLSEALHGKNLYVLFICFAIQGVSTIVVQHIPPFLTEIGKSVVASSVIMGIFSVVLIIGKPFLGFLFDRFGAFRSLLLNFFGMAAGMWMMIQGKSAFLYAGIILLGFGMASVTVLFPLITNFVFGVKEYASIWGVMSMAISCGTACGSPVWGAVYDLSGSYRLGFLIMPVVIIINAIVIGRIVSSCHKI